MRGNSALITLPLMAVFSAVIAYGLVFWTPWFGVRNDYGFDLYDYYGGGWVTTGYYETSRGRDPPPSLNLPSYNRNNLKP